MLRLFVLLAVVGLPTLAGAEMMIRIAVSEGSRQLEASGEALRVRVQSDEGSYEALPDGTIRIGRKGPNLTIDGVDTGATSLRLRSDAPIDIAGKKVRGSVEVLAQGSGLLAVNELPMETYLAAVLGSEMPPAFEPEALRAQAIAARTYAVGKRIAAEDKPYHLGSTVLAQVYGGVHREDPRTRAAVEATTGLVLVHEHAPIEAYFFSSCGGHTEAGAEALGRALPYLVSRECQEAPDTPSARWRLALSAAELGRRLGLPAVDSIRISSRTGSGRARHVEVRSAKGTRRFTAVELRRRLGYGELKSLAFDVTRDGGTFRFVGRGNGHGAGLCQWGAQAAAKAGWDHVRILAHYYPGAELRPMY